MKLAVRLDAKHFVAHERWMILPMGGKIVVVDTRTKAIRYEDVDFADAILAVLEKAEHGDGIFIANGDYTLTKKVTVSRMGLTFRGESLGKTEWGGFTPPDVWGTVIRAKNGLNDHMFEITKITGVVSFPSAVFENIGFDGNKANQSAGSILYFVQSARNVIKNCYLMNAYGYAIDFADSCGNSHILFNTARDNNGVINLANDSSSNVIDGNNFHGTGANHVINHTAGRSGANMIVGNLIGGSYPFVCNGVNAPTNSCFRTVICSNRFLAFNYCIYLGNGSQPNTVVGNVGRLYNTLVYNDPANTLNEVAHNAGVAT